MLESRLNEYEERIRSEGIAAGISRGKAEGRIEVARKMKGLGFDAETIFNATGVKIE